MADKSDNQTSAKDADVASSETTATGNIKALLGRKLGMTQVFTDKGVARAVTLVEAGPCTVTGIRSEDKDGYEAVQIGFGTAKHINKSQEGHLKKSKSQPSHIREVRQSYDGKVGDSIDVEVFEVGDKVTVTGISKGKGFAGTIKRHNFSRGPMSHGSRNKRRPGSIGSMYPQKIFKGKKMAGRMGGDRVTVKNLGIEAVDSDNKILAISGAVPGRRGEVVLIKGQK